MKMSGTEKLILLMLSEIHEKLGIKNGTDAAFVKEAIYSGNLWGLADRYSGIFEAGDHDRETAREVGNILDMWWLIEGAYAKLSKADKDKIKAADLPFKAVAFLGFDGNYETEHMGITRFYVEHLQRFTYFKDREFNSHMPTLDRYRRMFEVFKPMRANLGDRSLTADEIITILKAASRRE